MKGGNVGDVEICRQELLMPGETVKSTTKGPVRLEGLRQREGLRINAHYACFATPVRWLEPNWVDYVKGGPNGGVTLGKTEIDRRAARYGIGGLARTTHTFWLEAVRKIYNEWYKWPEDDDMDLPTMLALDTNTGMPPAVTLESTYSRIRDNYEPDVADRTVDATGDEFELKDLVAIQGQYMSAMKRGILSAERYNAMIEELWGGQGEREVDQVPHKVRQLDLTTRPNEVRATDGPSLGKYMATYEFEIDDTFSYTAQEHTILTYVMVIRFDPTTNMINPLSYENIGWEELVGDPEILATKPAVPVETRELFGSASQADTDTFLGYLPAGWQQRAQWSNLGEFVSVSKSHPFMLEPTNIAQCRDASRTNNAFVSQQFKDYLMDFEIIHDCKSRLPTATQSVTLNMEKTGMGAFPGTNGKTNLQ